MNREVMKGCRLRQF